jgi:hypothetical protein
MRTIVSIGRTALFSLGALAALGFVACAPALADTITGRVLGAGAPIADSTVTLWAAGSGGPAQLGQTKTDADGRFTLTVEGKGADLYVVAQGGRAAAATTGGVNPAIALLSVLGTTPLANVLVNEMTTVASIWTHNQFIDGTAIKCPALSLKIAAGNVPNFVDLATGGWGEAIQGPLNSNQTTTMANFATIADGLSGCIAKVTADACDRLFEAARGPTGAAPTDTLRAVEAAARYPSYRPERLFAFARRVLSDPPGRTLRPTPRMPYLSYAPSAWVLPLKFGGGGLKAPGKIMFDDEGNAWTGANFIVGSQASDELWDGNLSKFAPNGKALSLDTTGFQGVGIEGPGFGTVVNANGRVYVTSTGSKTISLFDKNGEPLAPPQGYNFGGQG